MSIVKICKFTKKPKPNKVELHIICKIRRVCTVTNIVGRLGHFVQGKVQRAKTIAFRENFNCLQLFTCNSQN